GAAFVTTVNEYSVPQSSVGICVESALPVPKPGTVGSATQVMRPSATRVRQRVFASTSPLRIVFEYTAAPAGSGTLNASNPLLLITRRFGSEPDVSARAKSKFITA